MTRPQEPFADSPEGCLLALRVQPRASRNEITGIDGGHIRVRLTAPPVDGAANAAVCVFIAEALGVPKSSVRVVRGETAREKRVLVRGVKAADAQSRLAGTAT